jgi:hypothetical protein
MRRFLRRSSLDLLSMVVWTTAEAQGSFAGDWTSGNDLVTLEGSAMRVRQPPTDEAGMPIEADIEALFRRESGRLISVLTRIFGPHNLELAEDVVQESFVSAMHGVVGERRARQPGRLAPHDRTEPRDRRGPTRTYSPHVRDDLTFRDST